MSGASHVLYGKNLIEYIPIDKYNKPITSSILLSETVPKLINVLDPTMQDFFKILKIDKNFSQPDVPFKDVGLITEISIG